MTTKRNTVSSSHWITQGGRFFTNFLFADDEDMKFKECVEFISNKNKKKSEPGLKFVKNQMQNQFMRFHLFTQNLV